MPTFAARRFSLWFCSLALCAAPAVAQSVYEKDLDFALDALERECAALIQQKRIDLKAVRKELSPPAKAARSDQDHLVLLTRLMARMQDGHAQVTHTEKTKEVRWPEEPERVGCGMFWCRSGKKILIKSVWNAAKDVGLEPGAQVIKVDGKAVDTWLDARMAEMRDLQSFSTPQQAFFRACHQGLAMPVGTRLELEFKDASGKSRKRTITYSKASVAPWGPAIMPVGLESTSDLNYGMLDDSIAYVHIRRCPDDLPAQLDKALAKCSAASGMVLDFRGNSGGGFDHEDFMGRFVPRGSTLRGQVSYESRGENPFAGAIVVIVDGTVVSAGETASGIFKEDGRAYMIGESPTAGMSSQKTTIELPSGLFGLYVSTHSNKGRFNGGRGIEGIGVIPHELVVFDAKDLAAGKDTLILRARELLAKFPKDKVPYKAP
jgi:C-terminal processing protease CtpA/Prc